MNERTVVASGDLERNGIKIHYELLSDNKKHYIRVQKDGQDIEQERDQSLPLPNQIMKMLQE